MDKFDDFGKKVFNEKAMKERLPLPVFRKWKAATNKSDALDRTTADIIAHAMKEWAMELGATHYCHWFQPLTASTAEKHDSFLDMDEAGCPIAHFSGKALIKGEPDASSFPNGGLRATFEARGYTYWDCTSPAFVRDNVLCIPTVFISFYGQALDQKTPLLKSIDVISKQASRIVNVFGDKDVTSVTPYIGLEQEYFLVDEKMYMQRRDLYITDHTLLGVLPSKGQELEDHYFGVIPDRVQKFMKDVDKELWELGIYAKTEHNEVAPCQFELAPLYSSINTAIDQNLIIMDTLKSVAHKHGLVCILHEKPFKGVNGSGKHNNWSLITNDGQNLFDPGDKPHENVRFLLVVCALLKAVDENATLIRMTCSGPGNDFRLGANEAPPAIVSVYLGKQIEDILSTLETNKPEKYVQAALSNFGLSTLSYLPHDVSDRNRTSPVAFTGNKFEFRMLGSSLNPAALNTALNVTVGSVFEEIADRLEKLKYRQEVREEALLICQEIIRDHKRIVFSGNGYSDDWVSGESRKRGLPNVRTFVEAIDSFTSPKTVGLYNKYGIMTDDEIAARANILYENYRNVISIDAKTLVNMVRQDVIPSFVKEVKDDVGVNAKYLAGKDARIVAAIDDLADKADTMASIISKMPREKGEKEEAMYCLKNVTPLIEEIRGIVDGIEPYMSSDNYPYPSYEAIFASVDKE